MEIPIRVHALIAIKAVAEKPVSAAFAILHAEIVAGEATGVLATALMPFAPPPPFRGDPFRPFMGNDIMRCTPPAEAAGRAVWYFSQHINTLGRIEEA
jgi:hypothetical protein